MNAEDADAVQFMEIASHLGYLGYAVSPPPEDATWYAATHPNRWNFLFTRWRGFLWLRCVVDLPAGVTSDCTRALEWVNEVRVNARVASYHVAEYRDGEHVIEATAFLPIAYDRQAFGALMLNWIEDTSRISPTALEDAERNEQVS
jgi:hypothetical protein